MSPTKKKKKKKRVYQIHVRRPGVNLDTGLCTSKVNYQIHVRGVLRSKVGQEVPRIKIPNYQIHVKSYIMGRRGLRGPAGLPVAKLVYCQVVTD